MAQTWTQQQLWQQLSPYQRAAAMAIMEADGRDPTSARNALGAIINRSEKTRDPLGEHVSKPIYQPTIEPSQFARLPSILKSPQFGEMTSLAEKRAKGEVGDWVNGATHFLASEKTMLDLYRQNPDKYHNWGPLPNSRGVPGQNWTGFDPKTGEYKGVVMRDASHAFLAPEGPHTGPQGAPSPQFAAAAPAGMGDDPSAMKPTQVASAVPSLGSGSTYDMNADATLTGLAGYWQKQKEDEAKEERDRREEMALARYGASAASKAETGASPMIAGPRLPGVDIGKLMSALKARGVDTVGIPNLGSFDGPLGTRRA